MHSFTEENYLKAIYKLSRKSEGYVNTNSIAAELDTKAASVTDMLKKLADKKLLTHIKYKGVELSKEGIKVAVKVVRKHRLWELFLVEKLGFKWFEVHEVAEELEHIDSEKLINRLDQFLGHPLFDPHGDPIPDENGNVVARSNVSVSDLDEGVQSIVVGVREHDTEFLKYLDKMGLTLGKRICVKHKFQFDDSMQVEIEDRDQTISDKVGRNLLVKIIPND